MNEECGVFGVFKADDCMDPAEATYFGLYALQHRGQESAGIAVTKAGQPISHYKNMGLVNEVFRGDLHGLNGADIAIGHVRYSTCGKSSILNAQPLVIGFRDGSLALAHNGNLVNAANLRSELEKDGAIFQTTMDTEIIASIIARNSSNGIINAIEKTMEKIRGSYALVIMTEDKLIGVRDPLGIRPLCLGKMDNSYMIASESCAFDSIDAEFIRDIHPGEMVVIDKTGLHSKMMAARLDSALCIFEYVYFARPDSDIDGINVYQARENAGALLAAAYPVEADVVAGVPDSATTAALGYAKQSGIPYKDVFAKNRYVGRTFIQPEQFLRERSVKIKLNVLKKNVRGKRVVLIDDSIVRGTTSKKIVQMLRLAGAKEVHMRISSPPIKFPCYFGIDTSYCDQLIGAQHDVREIRKIIGADSLYYLSIEDLLKSVEGSSLNLCVGCFNGNYPIDVEDCKFREDKFALEK
ncbi:MAG: amidophosphoribosyltransferase [Eubacteriales bacterium]